eukprot:15462636-Alexandrium_andersonii.AAC.2
MAAGVHPLTRHDNKPWRPEDSERAAAAGKPLGLKSCVLGIKGDWNEFCGTFGFPNWASNLRPCPRCSADPQVMYDRIPACSPCSLPWHLTTHEDYTSACDRCEVRLQLDAQIQAALKPYLEYDKRKAGNRG